MIYEISNPSVLDSISKMNPGEMDYTVREARIIESLNGDPLIFLEDYISLVDSGKEDLIYSTYHIDPSRLGFIVDEVKIIDNPHYLSNRRHYIKNARVSIRPMNTRRTRKSLNEALEFFLEYDDPTLFDQFLLEEEDILGDLRRHFVKSAAEEAEKAIPKKFEQFKKEAKEDAKSTLKKGAMLAGVMYAGKKVADHIADVDARKPRWQRSELIKKLRALRGKLPEYESKYERAEREHWQNKGVIGKIIWKIKSAIKWIEEKLHRLVG